MTEGEALAILTDALRRYLSSGAVDTRTPIPAVFRQQEAQE